MHLPNRTRWTVPSFVAVLIVPLLMALPGRAAAAAPGDYLGYLSSSATGDSYVVQDANGGRVFGSTPDAVDGAVGAVREAGPTIAYVTESDSGSSYVDRLHVVTPGGSPSLVYSATPGTDISDLSIAPNGRDVAFVLDDDDRSAILVVDTTSRELRTVRSSTTTGYFGPSFSPDGEHLAWAQVSRYYTDVVVARYATGAAQVISQAGSDTYAFTDTAWAPDSAQLAVVRDDYDQNIDDTYTSMLMVDVRTHSTRVAVRGQVNSDGSLTEYLEPTWAGDGDTLLMTKLTRSEGSIVGELVRLPPNQGGFTEPVQAEGYAGAPSVATAVPADSTPPGAPHEVTGQSVAAVARVTFALPPDADLADLLVTRVEGAPSDTYTPGIEVGRTWTGPVDVALPKPSTEYGISLFARDWAGNLSPAGKVSVTSAPPSTLSVTSPPPRIHWRSGVKLTGNLAGAAPLPNEKVALFARRAMTSSFVQVAASTTNGEGNYTLTYNPPWTAELQVRFAGSPRAYPVMSVKRVVTVIPAVNLVVSTAPIRLGASVTISGNVGPNHAGQIVYIQRKVNGVWRSIASARLGSTSTYRLVYRPGARGTWELRAYKPADADHASTTSPGRTFQVR